jgi:acetyl-CoA carboxylase biotin carboxyl carrier protein
MEGKPEENKERLPKGRRKGESMKFTEVRKLVRLVESSGIHELEFEKDGTRIRVRKADPAPVAAAYTVAAPAPVASFTPPASAPVPAASAPAAEAPAKKYDEIKSPMVGTFYRAPAPDAEPYVQVGDLVKTGQTLCIIEAMKLMNEIETDMTGIVKEILLENAAPVEFGQVMFRIDPQG